MGRATAIFMALLSLPPLLGGCNRAERTPENPPLRILMDQTPATLNPRATLDASSQRINVLLFRALTRLDSRLVPQPDLAESWEALDSGRVWKFRIRKDLKDHSGTPIGPDQIRQCLENYRNGQPASPLIGGFPGWVETQSDLESVTLRLDNPNPYLHRNASLLRYFRTQGAVTPCSEPKVDESVIGSGDYRAEPWTLFPEDRLRLVSMGSGKPGEPSKRGIDLFFVQDDNTKALKLLRGEIDATQNSISLTKARWIESEYGHRFDILQRDGIAVSYLAFNLRDPLLSRLPVRQAITLGIDRERIIRNKLFGFGSRADSFLSPHLPESHTMVFPYDPKKAEALLDAAGLRRTTKGTRFAIRYKSTPAREGIETALMFQDMLGKIGIELIIDVVEPAVFFASIRKGAFQMFSSRWLGVADGSILYSTLHTGQPLNRVGYSKPEMDRLLDQALSEPSLEKRLPLLREVQIKMAEDIPYFPLWFWSTALILKKGWKGLNPEDLSLSGAIDPLTRLQNY